MPVTIGFEGLCAIVSETPNVQTSGSLDVLLIDAVGTGLVVCPHDGVMTLPAAGLEGDVNLTVADPADGARRRMDLAGKKLKFLPGGQFPNRGGITTSNLGLIPEMRQVCEIGTVDSGCFTTPPTRPIAARIELPLGGTLSGNAGREKPEVWSFVPKVNACYSGRFTWEALYELPAADHVVIEVKSIADDKPLGSLTLRTGEARIGVSNRCREDAPETPSDDPIVYYEILDPPFSEDLDRPLGRKTANCEVDDILDGGGIGCIPYLLSKG